MSSERSKRRKVRQELDNINRNINLLNSINKPVKSTVTYECEKEITKPNNLIYNSLPITKNSRTNLNSGAQIVNSFYDTTLSPTQEENIIVEPEISLISVNTEYYHFTKDLAVWAVDCNVPQSTVNNLLHLMKKYDNINTNILPRYCRTLLATPRFSGTKLRSVAPGQYYHFGLSAGIQKFASSKLNEIQVFISVDGLPLTKNTNSKFWPILAYIVGTNKTVFPVGVYHGFAKPKDSDVFLSNFIEEAKHLLVDGNTINGVNKKVFIKGFVSDSPAKSFVLKTKGHSGFSSFSRCTIEGEYFQNRVCFPYSRNKYLKRTHESYVQQTQQKNKEIDKPLVTWIAHSTFRLKLKSN